MNLVGELPVWIGVLGAILSLSLVIGAFRKAPESDPAFFNYLRPKRFLFGIFALAASVDIIFF
ncbi:MAG: hypothetical protein AAFY74_19190 [Pseudomonadota bacterium]